MDNKYLIIYHKEDNDGVISANLFRFYLEHDLDVKLEQMCFIGATYNELDAFTHEDIDKWHEDFGQVVMLDISFNDPKMMKQLYEKFGSHFIWIDHHAPIIKTSYKMGFGDVSGWRDTTRSTILLVYKYLFDVFDLEYKKKKVPELLRILSAWDSFTFEREGYTLDFVRNVNKAVTYKTKLENHEAYALVREIMNNSSNCGEQYIENLHKLGKMLNDYDDQTMKSIIKDSGDFRWVIESKDNTGNTSYRSACAIFHQGASNSLMFSDVKDHIDNGLVFKHQANGNWTISMYNTRNDDKFDCGAFLKKKYKGGGHIGAAGCTVDERKFIKLLKTKIL